MKRLSMILIALFFSAAGNGYWQPAAFAQQVVSLSSSAQVAEAFGREIVDDFIRSTGLKVNLHITSSQTAVNRLKNGFADIATSTRPMLYGDRESGYVEIPFCKDPLAVIVAANCPVDTLSREQLRMIFAGRISNWQEIGGVDLPITVVVPGETTGAYLNFKRQAMGHYPVKHDFMTPSSTMDIVGVRHLPGAISFIAQGAVSGQTGVKTLAVDGKLSGDPGYAFYQVFYLVTKGKPTGLSRDVVNYALSERGRAIMLKKGMVPVFPGSAPEQSKPYVEAM